MLVTKSEFLSITCPCGQVIDILLPKKLKVKIKASKEIKIANNKDPKETL